MTQVNRCIPVILYQQHRQPDSNLEESLIPDQEIWFPVVEFVPHTESTSQNHCAQLFFQGDLGMLSGQIFFICIS